MTRVVKIGGAAMGDPGWLVDFATAVASAEGPLVIVHGGGREIDALSERLGVEVAWNGGRRVTTPAAFEVASMVLTGRLNKRIVSALLDVGVDALGLSGEDGGLVTAGLADGGALGRVGVVERVRVDLLEWLASRGLVPVISPISRGPDGSGLNVNADEVATAVAAALGASELLYLTDVAGVSDGTGVRASLDTAEAHALIDGGVVTGGMALKVRAAVSALEAGIPSVRIGRPELILDAGAGTCIEGYGPLPPRRGEEVQIEPYPLSRRLEGEGRIEPYPLSGRLDGDGQIEPYPLSRRLEGEGQIEPYPLSRRLGGEGQGEGGVLALDQGPAAAAVVA